MVPALCQDCFRVWEFTDWETAMQAECSCGGRICACPKCYRRIQSLHARRWESAPLGLPAGVVLLSWDARDGACFTDLRREPLEHD